MIAQCQHNYCPHLHFKKCRRQRESKIPYTYKPKKQIELTCNVHPKMLNLTTFNIPTLAYEQYSFKRSVPDQEDMNFSKNYYLQNCPDNFQLRNTLVKDKEEELYEQSAYVLAINASKQYNNFSRQRKEYLVNAQKRAKISYHNYFQKKKEDILKLKEEQNKWVIDYYRKVQQLINHMFGKEDSQNVDPNLQDKLFIKENQSKNVKFLAGFKVSEPNAALQILKSLRALLLRKKLSLQEERKNQDHNKSVSASCIDNSVSQSQDVTQGSFLSVATNDLTKEPGQQHFAEQFCDFQTLQKRWGVKNVQEIRNIIRRVLAKSMVINAQGREMREKKAAKLKDELLKKQMKEMGQLTNNKSKANNNSTKSTKKNTSQSIKKDKQHINKDNKDVELLPMFRQTLNNQQFQVKSSIMKGGQFDSVGNKYERNRNYSLLFQKKKAQSELQLSFRQEKSYYRPHSSRK